MDAFSKTIDDDDLDIEIIQNNDHNRSISSDETNDMEGINIFGTSSVFSNKKSIAPQAGPSKPHFSFENQPKKSSGNLTASTPTPESNFSALQASYSCFKLPANKNIPASQTRTNHESSFSLHNQPNISGISNSFTGFETDIILIEPSDPNEATTKKFLNNDLEIAKNLEKSEIGKAGIEYVNKNRSRNILIVKIKDCRDHLISKILAISKLGDYKVSCRLPTNKTQSIGVIGPIGLDTSLTDLKNSLINQNYEVSKIERIFKGKEKTATLSIKVFFDKNELPEHVYVGYQRFKVSVYVGIPWQCYNCQGFGHNAAHCRYKSRCLVCAGPHQLKDCNKKNGTDHITDVLCPNCKGKHTANYGGCPAYKEAKSVEKIRVTNKLSYRDAVQCHKQGLSQLVQIPSGEISNTGNYKKNVPQSKGQQSTAVVRNITTATISTQTDISEETQTDVEVTAMNGPNLGLIKGLAQVISNIFDSKNNLVSDVNIIEIFNKAFNVNLDNSDINLDQSNLNASNYDISETETEWSSRKSKKNKKRKKTNSNSNTGGDTNSDSTSVSTSTRSQQIKKKK